MNKLFSRISLLFCGVLMNSMLFAQDQVAMADEMRNNGKIYVVVAVCLTILAGLFIYVWMLDRKMTRIEKNRD